jgi:hypothetical protein
MHTLKRVIERTSGQAALFNLGQNLSLVSGDPELVAQ